MKIKRLEKIDPVLTTNAENKYIHLLLKEIGYNKKIVCIEDIDEYYNKVIDSAVSNIIWIYTNKHNEYYENLNELVSAFKKELLFNTPKYLVNNNRKVISREDEINRLQKSIEEWNSKSKFEKMIIGNSRKNKPPTLSEGWFIFIFFILIESVFKGAFVAWFITTIIFLIWRKKEFDKYN